MKKFIAFMVTVFILYPDLSLAGEGNSKGERPATEASTVKSSTSNSSDRSMKAEDSAKKDAAMDQGVPTDKPRDNAPHHDTSKNSINNIR